MTEPAPPAPLIHVRDLTFRYDREPVLDGVTFAVHPGDFVSVIGPNGGGKTTLLKLLLGLLSPQRGTVEVFGRPPVRVRHRLGYVPQHLQIDPQFPVNVRDVVATGCLGRGRAWGPVPRRDRAAIDRALHETGTRELADQTFAQLSGGQRQRVMIARALAADPGLLLLDEPTASLDPGIQADIFGLLKELNAHMTIVMVSHDVNMVSQHVNRVLCVNVTMVEHCFTRISGELEQYFPGHQDMRLVRHAHDHSGGGIDHD